VQWFRVLPACRSFGGITLGSCLLCFPWLKFRFLGGALAKTVLVTGTSSGIGRITAEFFSAKGWNVAACSRNPGTDPFLTSGNRLISLQMDVTKDESVSSAVAEIQKRFGSIDVLINNAGYGLFGPLEGANGGELEAQFSTNVFGAARVIRHVLPAMRAQRSGMIVNVSSIGGRMASPFASGYHATKFAIEGLSESLRYELSLHGIQVKLIEPSHFKTGFIARSLMFTEHPAYHAAFQNYMDWVHHEDAKAPDPAPVAEAIFKAANDSSRRLRYPVKGRLILALTALLPDSLWRSLLAEGMTRPVRKKTK
jgi:NAD(P)-dependent dehydrogenase (short-subunit alcohol dehydrogenase family)